jgi:flagellar protein FliO/FliZ
MSQSLLNEESTNAAVSVAPVIDATSIAEFGMSLIVVIAVILLVGWFYSRLKVGAGRGGDQINVVANRPLGPKERLLVIEVAGQQLLVGMTASQLQTLHVFDSPAITVEKPNQEPGFGARLRTALQEIGK